jgi:hypothetical protein
MFFLFYLFIFLKIKRLVCCTEFILFFIEYLYWYDYKYEVQQNKNSTFLVIINMFCVLIID